MNLKCILFLSYKSLNYSIKKKNQAYGKNKNKKIFFDNLFKLRNKLFVLKKSNS